jgi:hypothetical protein
MRIQRRRELTCSPSAAPARTFPKGVHIESEPIETHYIVMSEDVQNTLDYVSKLTREPGHIERLIQDGEKHGRAFLEKRVLL